jgi:hypothetical protein
MESRETATTAQIEQERSEENQRKRGKTKAPANPGYGGFLLSCSRILRGTANRVTRHTPGLHALSPGPLSPSSCVLVRWVVVPVIYLFVANFRQFVKNIFKTEDSVADSLFY